MTAKFFHFSLFSLNLYSGEITKQAVLNIEKGSVLNINGLATQASSYFTSATVNADDKFAGDVRLIGGIFNLEDVSVSVGATSTTVGGELPYYENNVKYGVYPIFIFFT